MNNQDIVDGFGERLQNMAVFAPLLDLNRKTAYDYSLLELGVAAMLFILEDMLLGENNCTYHRLSEFLRQQILKHYDDRLTYEEGMEFTYYLVRDCLMNGGRPHQLNYHDFEEEEEEVYKFHLVKLEDYNVREKKVRLKLSTVGLELLFKTKEMYNELQVSISQLYLRQQIKKGVFDGALRSVEELALAVRNEKHKLRELEEKINRDVLQVARERELEERLKRVKEQLEREKRVFLELQELIEHTLEEYHSGSISDGEEEAIEKIMKIRRRLQDIVSEHESLFTDKISIQQLMNSSIEDMIMHAFNARLNFEKELLHPFLDQKSDPSILKKLLEPLFGCNLNSHFNPGKVFSEQSLRRVKPEEEEDIFKLQEDFIRQEEERERQQQLARRQRLKEYLHFFLQPLTSREEIAISEVLKALEEKHEDLFERMIGGLDFYSLLVRLHQLGPIPLLKREEVQGAFLDELPWVLVKIIEENEELSAIKGFQIEATDREVKLPNGYLISDFIVKRSDPNGVE